MKKLLSLILFSLISVSAFAQTPTTVTFQQGVSSYTGMEDTYMVDGASANSNFNGDGNLWFRSRTSSGFTRTTLMRFDISSIPTTATITAVTLTGTLSTDVSSGTHVWVFGGLRSWVEAQATWNNFATGSAWGAAGGRQDTIDLTGDYLTGTGKVADASLGTSNDTNEPITFTSDASFITLVQNSLASGSLNLILMGEYADNVLVSIYDSEHATTSNHPKLTITYTDGSTPPPDPEPEPEPEVPTSNTDYDQFGGYKKMVDPNKTAVLDRTADSVTSLCLRDTGAFAGKNLYWHQLQPDVTEYIYFLIESNTDDEICIKPPDRLKNQVVVNGSMELDSNWSNYNTPTTNERSNTQAKYGTYSRHVVGDSANDGITQTGIQFDLKEADCTTPHNSSWTGLYTGIGWVYVVSGTVFAQFIDGDGTTSMANVQIGTTAGGVWEDFKVNADSNFTSACGNGAVRFYCSGGACEFYLDGDDTQFVGENDYGTNNPFLVLTDFNDGDDEYAVFQKMKATTDATAPYNNRGHFDPEGNFWIPKCVNNFDPVTISSLGGVDNDGATYCTALGRKYPGYSACEDRAMNLIEPFKDMGFNCIGSIAASIVVDDNWRPDMYGFIPVIRQYRMEAWNLAPVGEINFEDPVGNTEGEWDGKWQDVYDPDFQDIFDYPNGAWGDASAYSLGTDNTQYQKTGGIESNQYDVTPYKARYLQIAANPWIFGYDFGEEVWGASSTGSDIGYMLMTTNPTDTTAADGVNETKIFMVNKLRVLYSVGGETTFIDNIDFEGSDEITPVSGWSGVAGYVSATKDNQALTALNNAWNTTYTSWAKLLYEDGDDDTDVRGVGALQEDANFETAVGCNRVYSPASSSTCQWEGYGSTQIRSDLTILGSYYARKLYKTFYDHLFGPNGYLKETKLPMGAGHTRKLGWALGVQAEDGSTNYVPSLLTNNLPVVGGSITSTNPIYPSNDPTDPGNTYDRLLAYCTAYDGPMHTESLFGGTAEPDTPMFKRGIVDAVYKRTDPTNAVYISATTSSSIGWDCDATVYPSIATYCSTANANFRFTEDQTVWWDCANPLAPSDGTCGGKGTVWWHFIKAVDQPMVNGVCRWSSCGSYTNRYIIITSNAGSIGTLGNNDLVTDGTKMFTIANTVVRVAMVVDNDADFDTAIDNPHAYNMIFGGLHLMDESQVAPDRNNFYRLGHGYATRRSMLLWKDWEVNNSYTGPPGDFRELQAGDPYHLQSDKGNNTSLFEVMTQELRGKVLTSRLEQTSEFRNAANQRCMLGWSLFSVMSDYGWVSDENNPFMNVSYPQGDELRNFGFFTIEGDKYDGVSAVNPVTGVPFGNVVTEVTQFQWRFESKLLPKNKKQGTNFQGVKFK